MDGLEDSPEKSKGKKRKRKRHPSKSGASSDSDEYAASLAADDTDTSTEIIEVEPLSIPEPTQQTTKYKFVNVSTAGDDVQKCGLCDCIHGIGACKMINDSANLMVYHKMLLNSKGEPWAIRVRRKFSDELCS